MGVPPTFLPSTIGKYKPWLRQLSGHFSPYSVTDPNNHTTTDSYGNKQYPPSQQSRPSMSSDITFVSYSTSVRCA